jgi:hypothetical protein
MRLDEGNEDLFPIAEDEAAGEAGWVGQEGRVDPLDDPEEKATKAILSF